MNNAELVPMLIGRICGIRLQWGSQVCRNRELFLHRVEAILNELRRVYYRLREVPPLARPTPIRSGCELVFQFSPNDRLLVVRHLRLADIALMHALDGWHSLRISLLSRSSSWSSLPAWIQITELGLRLLTILDILITESVSAVNARRRMVA